MSEYFDSVMRGLNEALEHTQGRLDLRTSPVGVIEPPKSYTPQEVRGIREKLNMSQGNFANVFGVSRKTVEAWEHGRNKPSGAAARLLTIAENEPDALRHFGYAG
ncbi:MAG: type II toxin-antitoxin system MqsA family antitoxin [Oscillospiraceae bacterium]|jgi:putative transcriptional regulator|nr:type II toxin-antitoxin system MqsA family antitoxin [Oscillospiraceae bacterium]